MPTIVVPASVQLCQIDDFPEEVEGDKEKKREFARTVRGKRKIKGGALYIRPASTLSVTDDELSHLEAKHPKLFRQLVVHSGGRSAASVAKPASPREFEDAPVSRLQHKKRPAPPKEGPANDR